MRCRMLTVAALVVGFFSVPLPDRACPGDEATPVKAVRVSSKVQTEVISGMGSIRCARNLNVGIETTGVVSKIPVQLGDRVAKGQIIAELDNSVLDAEIVVKECEMKAADAELNYYSQEYAKRKELYGKQAVSDTELNKAFYESKRAEARVETLKSEKAALGAKKSQRVLRSPISGTVAKRYVDTGAVVTPGMHRVFQLIQCEDTIAEIELEEKVFRMIRPGQKVTVHVDALGGLTFSTVVDRICPVIDDRNRTFTIEARIANAELALASGMFIRADIDTTDPRRSVRVPRKAVRSHAGKDNYVFVVKDNVAVSRKVLLGSDLGNRLEVRAGLSDGDVVVVEGHDRLKDFTDVSVSLLDRDGRQ
ncbi:MAG: efflux RND transporter periplasmic adaptor subunit [Pseudomonadota bacterium]